MRNQEESPFVTTWGTVLEYLGLTTDTELKVKWNYQCFIILRNFMDEFPNDMVGTAKMPAASHLFMMNQECEKIWNYCTYAGEQEDIQKAVAFLCTRVKDPVTDDYKKHTCVMKYRRVTEELMLMIKPGDHPNWSVDSSHAVSQDMRNHSRIYMILSKGVTYSGSTKQSLNTKS